MKSYDAHELAQGDGRNPDQILVAVNGNIYNVAKSKKWVGGRHMNRHQAGRDLSAEIKGSPHGPSVLERFDMVGTFAEGVPEPTPGFKGRIEAWIHRYPFFRRHPHPALAHAPVGLMPAIVIFELVALAFGSYRMEWAAFSCLVLVLLALPVTMGTGYFTWWLNYESARFPLVTWKRRLAWIALPTAVVAVALRASVSDPLAVRDPYVATYVVLVLVLAALMSAIGYLGGRLTFPYG